MILPRSSSLVTRPDFSNNIPLLNIFAALKMALLPMAIITLFWKDQIGLSLTDILLLQAIFSMATMIMEYPSGYLSDRLGYRFSLNLACLLGITGWATYTMASSFTGILIAELQLGASYAFISGSDSALLYESLKHSGKEELYSRYDGRMTAWAQAGEAAGALGAGLLYSWMPLLPFILQVGVWIMALLICRTLTEVPAAEQQTTSHVREAMRIADKAFISAPGLRYTILLAALLGLSSFYPVWLIQPYMQSLQVPVSWFGPIWAGANLCVSFGSMLSHRVQYHLGSKGTTALLLVFVMTAYAGLAFTQAIWSFSFYFLLTIMRGIQGPFLRLAIQKQSDRHERASILSLKSLVFRLGFVLSGPIVGLIADRYSIHNCFFMLLIIMSLLIIVTLKPFHRYTNALWSSH